MPEKVRCKFYCSEISEVLGSTYVNGKYVSQIQYRAKFHVVSDNTEEDKKFFASTPSGQLEFACISKRFEVGKKYYLDIVEAADQTA